MKREIEEDLLEEKKLQLGIRISQTPLSWDPPILSVPFYMIGELQRLAASSYTLMK